MRKLILLASAFLLLVATAQAQDPQYSQFYAAPLYLNPAFAGSALTPRVAANYRWQWPNQETQFTTFSVGADTYFDRYNSGIGLLITRDQQGPGKVNSTDLGLQYAYQLRLSETVALRAGIQGSYVFRNADYFGLTFGDQFSGGGFGGATGEPLAGDRLNYVDVSAGGLLFSRSLYLGFAADHLTRPEQSFAGSSVRLPMHFTANAGIQIPLAGYSNGLAEDVNAPERTLSPALLYKRQGNFDQLDAGLYLTWEPLVVGLWYRGLPIKQYAAGNLTNNDAAIILVGFKREGLSIGYSYDLTISNLGPSTGGAHELSLTYTFPEAENVRRRPSRRSLRLPCPKF